MILLRFYRMYLSLLGGAIVFLTLIHSWWAWLASSILLRIIWAMVENRFNDYRINKHFEQHSYEFKQLLGPYGIRMINKAESDPMIKKSLCEVFTPDLKKLQETLKQLEMMDTLFTAGLRPDSDTYHLHDLKLKYARHRLQKTSSQN